MPSTQPEANKKEKDGMQAMAALCDGKDAKRRPDLRPKLASRRWRVAMPVT